MDPQLDRARIPMHDRPIMPAIVQELAAIAAYVRTQYSVSVPKFDAPS